MQLSLTDGSDEFSGTTMQEKKKEDISVVTTELHQQRVAFCFQAVGYAHHFMNNLLFCL